MPSIKGRSAKISSPRDPLRGILLAVTALLGLAATAVRRSALAPAARTTAMPFLTLASVIAIGALGVRVGVFRWLARCLIPLDASPALVLAAVLAFTAVISAGVNLDVAVVVAMPVALEAAERSSVGVRFLAPAVASTANAASFLLPTSNVTNLLVLSRAPISTLAYVHSTWLAWLLVMAVTVVAFVLLIGRDRHDQRARPARDRRASPGLALDIGCMFVAVTAARALLGAGLVLHGNFAEQAASASVLAASVNNLPAAAAVVPVGPTGRWAAILAMAIGPNLVLWGSVATLICGRLARDAGADLGVGRFTLVGLSLVPLQLGGAFLGLHLTHTL